MAEDNAGPASRPSWHEREIASALQRLANARAQLSLLEEQAAATASPDPVDPDDLRRADALEADIAKLTAKASNRFGGSSARAKLDEATRELQLLLGRHGVETVAELRATPTPAVDPTVLDFARRECADAEQAFLEVAAMVIPDEDAEPVSDGPDAEVIAAADSFADDDLDLRIEPSAAS